jgi:hypothetical protein
MKSVYKKINKYFILTFLMNSFLISEVQHPELTAYNVLESECPTCERIYSQRNQMNFLNKYRIELINTIINWLKTQPETKATNDIRSLLKQIEDFSDKIITRLANDPKVQNYIAEIQKLIIEIDPLLPRTIRLSDQNYYETMQEIFDINNDLKTTAIPDIYRSWLTRRLTLSV